MKISRTKFKVPYTHEGSLHRVLPCREGDTQNGRVFWLPNDPFTLDLEIVQPYRRGITAKYFMWKALDDREFPMFAGDVAYVLANVSVKYGWITSTTWFVRKSGQQFGIVPWVGEQ